MGETSRVHQVLAALAASLGALALAAGEPYPSRSGRTDAVNAVEVARWIRQPKPGLRVIDLRSARAFTAYHIPGAEHVDVSDLTHRDWSAGSTIVLYAADDESAVEAARVARSRGAATVHVLDGGLAAWIAQIIDPRLAPLAPSAAPAERAARREHLELSRYFGGTPVVSPDAIPVPPGRRQSEADAIART